MDNVDRRLALPAAAAGGTRRKAKRRIGLGVTGLADALIMCGVRYGSPEAVRADRRLAGGDPARRLSRLGRPRRGEGRLPAVRPRRAIWPARPSRACPRTCATAIAPHGIRNALLTSIAPTGTISLFADNVSSRHRAGLRLQLHAQGAACPTARKREEEVERLRLSPVWRALKGDDAAARRTSSTPRRCRPPITWRCRRRRRTSSTARSPRPSTCPSDISFEDFKDVYTQAYELGCKGCTTYRPNEVTGSVLAVEDAECRPADAVTPRCAAADARAAAWST